MALDKSIQQRFWSKVDKRAEDECWLWKAGRFNDGYGSFWVEKKDYRSHRVAYVIAKNLELEGIHNYLMLHSCDVPLCCNPNHLRLGTSAENMHDKVIRGRNYEGEKHYRAKLTSTQILEIRKLKEKGYKRCEIAAQFNVTPQNITHICLRKNWKHVL